VTVKLPPLRERREDIPLLVSHFIKDFNQRHGKRVTGITEPVRKAMAVYDWPGNVRELRNCVEYLYNTVEAELVLRENLPPEIAPQPPTPSTSLRPPPSVAAVPTTVAPGGLEAVERQFLAETMQRLGGKPVDVAKVLGISRSTMYRKLKKHGLI
jgi:DNA-binding NtrC family response regulator